MDTLGEVIDRTAEIRDRLAALEVAPQPNAAQLENIEAGLEGLEAEVRDLVRDLDRIDELDFAVVADGQRTIGLWRWRRGVRAALVGLWLRVRAAGDVARELAGGQRRRVIVSREGDTLQTIAARELGDWRDWPRLLAANPTLTPGALASGTTLVVPEKR